MKRFWIWGLLFCTATAQADLASLIPDLGGGEVEVRNRAQRLLEEHGSQRPRETILLLAEQYRTATDLEIQSRLEVILTDLAREWMFYVPPGFLGINFQMIHLGDDDMAVEVLQVLPEGAAEAAGFRAGDLILEIGGVDMGELQDQETFVTHISRLRPGSFVDVVIQRGDKTFSTPLVVGLRSMEQMDVQAFAREEERKLAAWLSDLRGEAPQDPRRPVGHFQVNGE